MLVTQISEVTKSRCRVYLDGQFAFVLYKGELRRFQIKENQELSEESYREIMTQILPKRAKLRSMNLLKSRAYTEHQIREKLRQGFYPETVIDEALEYIKSFHYIDDRRYVKDYIVYHCESRSRGRIEQDLCRKGIGRDLIRVVYEEDLEEELPDETVLIKKLLQKKNYDRDHADYQERQKMGAFLYRKGFSLEKIEKIL